MSTRIVPPAETGADDAEPFAGVNLYACFQCTKCSSSCPYGLSPQRVIRLLQLGQEDKARALPTTELCAGCMTCTRVCPKGLNPMGVVHELAGKAKGCQGLRGGIFAHIHAVSRLGSRLAPLSNWMTRLPGAALVNHYLLGIHKARTLPPYAVESFPAWFEGHQPCTSGDRGAVVLFHDTFMDYNFPEIGIAATQLLERAGYRVELADMVCCGRPMISNGFRENAARHAVENINRLFGPAAEGKWIVGCEPSCLLTLRSEYAELAPCPETRERARVVARQALLIDEFLEIEAERPDSGLRFAGPGARGPNMLLFHSHCHHKAQAQPECSRRLLERAGYHVVPVRANCCGMAGSWGAHREHFERSRRTFEEGVGLALGNDRQAGIAVSGVSCRIQITDLGPDARQPRHVVQWLCDALATDDAPPAQPATTTSRPQVILSR